MTAFILKIIACSGMALDHLYAASVRGAFPFSVPTIFNSIGRFVFPVFAYMIAQGCKHTKNINKYLLRLGIFALISEIPFDIAFGTNTDVFENISFLNQTNVFYTLFLGVACIALYEKLKSKLSASETETRKGAKRFFRKLIPFLPMIPIVLTGSALNVDYGMFGIIFIIVFYFTNPENKITRTITAAGVVIYYYGYPYIFALFHDRGVRLPILGQMIQFSDRDIMLNHFLFSLIAVLLIFLYNGKQGVKMKWAFYAFYPVHIAILAAIKVFL